MVVFSLNEYLTPLGCDTVLWHQMQASTEQKGSHKQGCHCHCTATTREPTNVFLLLQRTKIEVDIETIAYLRKATMHETLLSKTFALVLVRALLAIPSRRFVRYLFSENTTIRNSFSELSL